VEKTISRKSRGKTRLRLVPEMTAAEAAGRTQSPLAKKGFGDIEVRIPADMIPIALPRDAASFV